MCSNCLSNNFPILFLLTHTDPTMLELRNHTRDVVSFALEHGGETGVARAKVVLVSAWNEFDEGHWICPSLRSEPTQTAKLEAIATGILEAHDQHNHND
jgi:hypothetical protein